MRLLGSAILLIFFSFSCFALQQSDASDSAPDTSSPYYISDDLIIFLHTGPGRDFRILGSIKAGLPVTKTDSPTENKYAEIIDGSGRKGWIEAKYLTKKVSRRVLVNELKEKALDTDAVIAPLHQEIDKAQSTIDTLTSSNDELKGRLAMAAQELTLIENQIGKRESEEKIRILSVGGGLVAAGLLLGIIISYLPKKRKRGDSWMN